MQKKHAKTAAPPLSATEDGSLKRLQKNGTELGLITLLARHKSEYVPAWIESLGELQQPADQSLIDTAADAWAEIVVDATDGGGDDGEVAQRQPPAIAKEFAPIMPNLLAGIGAIISGLPMSRLQDYCGLPWGKINLSAKIDKAGFGLLLECAMKQRESRRRAARKDEIERRLAEGSERVLVVRTARDHDEIRTVRVRNDTLLMKAAELDAAEVAAAQARAPAAGGSGVTNIGTIYNVQVPAFLAEAREPPKGKEIPADTTLID